MGPLFDEASSELLIVSPYFIPGSAGTDYLRATRLCKLYDFELERWMDYRGNIATWQTAPPMR